MSDRQNGHGIFIYSISHDIPTVTKVYRPLAEHFGKVIHKSTESGVSPQHLHALSDGFTSATCGIRVPCAQKLTKTL